MKRTCFISSTDVNIDTNLEKAIEVCGSPPRYSHREDLAVSVFYKIEYSCTISISLKSAIAFVFT